MSYPRELSCSPDLRPESVTARAEANLHRFYEAVSRVNYFNCGTIKNLCAAITLATLFGVEILDQIHADGFSLPQLSNWTLFWRYYHQAKIDRSLFSLGLIQSDTQETLVAGLLNPHCLGGLCLTHNHVTPLLSGPVAQANEADPITIYYLPQQWRDTPHSLIAPTELINSVDSLWLLFQKTS